DAFSPDHWRRPPSAVGVLMGLFERYLAKERRALADAGVSLRVVGRRDRLHPRLVEAIQRAEAETAGGSRLSLRVAVDYSSRHAMLEALKAAAATGAEDVAREDLTELLGEVMHAGGPSRDVDLLIRTGGEQRLSDFLLWECAYAELFFTDTMWPDFGGDHLAAAMRDFAGRERRFGNVKIA